MRLSAMMLVLLSLIGSASAGQHHVQVQVLSTMSQTVRGVGDGMSSAAPFTAVIPCSQPYPGDSVSVTRGQGSVDQCVLASPAHEATGMALNQRVEAILTTEEGQSYYAILGCQKTYSWCARLADQANYAGKLNDKPKWLADYQHRPFYGLMKISLRPGGKKKVTYLIEYAAKANIRTP
ncbi:MAG: hypothetical protein ACJ71Q_20035 [Terriglobales bacterium]